MKRLTTAGACCLLLLAACSPPSGGSPSGWEASTGPSTRSVTPVASPSPTPAPSPSPFTQKLSEEQQAALDAVKEFFRVLDLVQANPEEDLSQLTLLYYNNRLASIDAQDTLNDRHNGVVMVGHWEYYYRSVGEPVEAGGMRSIKVSLCIDGTHADFVDPNNNSVLDPNRSRHTNMSLDMVKTEHGWLVNDSQSEDAKQC